MRRIKTLLALGFPLTLLAFLLAGCTGSTPLFDAWFVDELVHPGNTVTIQAVGPVGSTFQFEIMEGNDVIYTRSGPETERTFTVEWWPWKCRVTILIDGDPESKTLVPVLDNDSPEISPPKILSTGDSIWNQVFIPMQAYVISFAPGQDEYGNRTGIYDPDGDSFEIVSVTIKEESNDEETTIVTWPYIPGVFQVGGLNGYPQDPPYEHAFEFMPTWSGKIKKERPYYPLIRGQGYWLPDCTQKTLSWYNLAPDESPAQKAKMKVVVEDQYGARSSKTFTLHIGVKTCGN